MTHSRAHARGWQGSDPAGAPSEWGACSVLAGGHLPPPAGLAGSGAPPLRGRAASVEGESARGLRLRHHCRGPRRDSPVFSVCVCGGRCSHGAGPRPPPEAAASSSSSSSGSARHVPSVDAERLVSEFSLMQSKS